MKKFTNLTSPFIMMLIPVLLVIGLLIITRNIEIPEDKIEASASFQMPSLKVMVQSVF